MADSIRLTSTGAIDDTGITIKTTTTTPHTNAPAETTFHIHVTETYLRKILALAVKNEGRPIDLGFLIEKLLRSYDL